MKLSTKVRYGVRAMLDLALYQSGRPVLVKSIAEREDLSKKYLESLLAALKSAGLLRSVRGAKGGYLLARPAEEITMEMIAAALEAPSCWLTAWTTRESAAARATAWRATCGAK